MLVTRVALLLAGLCLSAGAAVAADENSRLTETTVAPGALDAGDLAGKRLVRALQGGGYVIFFRHTETDLSEEDVDTSNLSNCSTQRNLNEAGRAAARAIGRAFRTLRIPVGRVIASKYCRTRDTARLAFGRAELTWGIAALSSAATKKVRTQRIQALRTLLGTRPTGRANTVVVGHIDVFSEVADIWLDEGDAAVFKPLGDLRFRFVARVRQDSWTRLAEKFG